MGAVPSANRVRALQFDLARIPREQGPARLLRRRRLRARAANRFFCAYPRDGTSLQQMRIRKGPGASAELWRRFTSRKPRPAARISARKPPPFRLQHWAAFESWAGAGGCSFPPQQLEDCLKVQPPAQYNEIVVDAARLRAPAAFAARRVRRRAAFPQSTRRAPVGLIRRGRRNAVRRVWANSGASSGCRRPENGQAWVRGV